jgi:hypothetical protein
MNATGKSTFKSPKPLFILRETVREHRTIVSVSYRNKGKRCAVAIEWRYERARVVPTCVADGRERTWRLGDGETRSRGDRRVGVTNTRTRELSVRNSIAHLTIPIEHSFPQYSETKLKSLI